jgi:hypothetical protein
MGESLAKNDIAAGASVDELPTWVVSEPEREPHLDIGSIVSFGPSACVGSVVHNPVVEKAPFPLVEMTHSPSTTGLGLAYNAFLFASISDDSGAAPLNTVSVLARLDIDPWLEAADLTRLPSDSAIRRLAALLVRMPGRPNGLADAEMIATRLVALLPSRNSAADAVPARTTNSGRALEPIFVAIAFGFAVVVLLSGLVQTSNDQVAAQTGGKSAVVSSSSPPAASQPDIRR